MGRRDFDALAADVRPDEVALLQARVRVRDTAVLMYTSGTTARPKGCMLSHEAIVLEGQGRAGRFGSRPASVWNPLPMFHTRRLMPMIGALRRRRDVLPPAASSPAWPSR